jgi:hypothetical protein
LFDELSFGLGRLGSRGAPRHEPEARSQKSTGTEAR